MDMAKESIGSVDEEMEIVMNSFEKRVEVMKNAWSSLANTTLDSSFVKGAVDFTTAIIRATEACGGLVPVLAGVISSMVALKIAENGLTGTALVNTVKQLCDSLITRIFLTAQATEATVALSVAEKTLIAGAVFAGVMAIGYGIHYLADASNRARENVSNLRNELTELQDKTKTLESLAEEFESLSKKGTLNTEEHQRLLDIQNQIKDLQPEIAGYYDEEGNFIITQGNSAKELLEIQRQIVAEKEKELLLASKKVIDDNLDKYEKEKQGLADVIKYLENKKRIEEEGANVSRKLLSEQQSLQNKIAREIGRGDLINSDEIITETKSKIDDAVSEISSYLLYSVTTNPVWGSLNKNTANAIRKSLSELSDEDIVNYASKMKSGEMTSSQFIEVLKQMPSTIEAVKEATESTSSSMENSEEQLSSLGVVAEQVAESTDVVKVAMNELNASGDISEKTMTKLIKKYPELAEKIKDVESAQLALTQKMAENDFDKATQGIADLTGVIEDLEAGNGLTASSFKKISENFPELLGYMSDEATLTEAIKDKMNDLKDAQDKAYRSMLENSESYYANNIKNNEEAMNTIRSNMNSLYTDVENGCSNLFSNLTLAYTGDLENWKTLAQGKADIETQLINQLNEAWRQHFGNLMLNFAKVSSAFAQTTPTFDEAGARASYQENNKKNLRVSNPILDKGLEDAYIKESKRVFEAQSGQYMQFLREMEKGKQKALEIGSDITFDSADIKVGGAKSTPSGKKGKSGNGEEKYSSYIKSLYDARIDAVMEGTDKLERVINNTNKKIELAEAMGNDGISKFVEDMNNVRTQLEDLSSSGNVDFTLRPKVDSSEMKKAGWNFEDGSYATTFTQGEFVWQGGEEEGQYVYVHYTPILPDGTVLTPSEIEDYLHNTLEHANDVLEADTLNIVMKVDNANMPEQDIKNFLNTGEMTQQMDNFLTSMSNWDDRVHAIQEKFYSEAVDLSTEGIKKLIASEKIGVDSEVALRYQLENSYKQRIKNLQDASIKTASIRKQIISDLNAKGYNELKGVKLDSMTQLDLDKIIRSLDAQIDQANVSDNKKLKANLDYKKSLIEDLCGNIIKANDQINALASETLDAKKELQSLQVENLGRVFDIKMQVLDKEEKIANLRKSMLLEDGGEYDKAEKEATQILRINTQLLNNIVQKRKVCEDQISEYRKLGYAEESEQIQSLTDKWIDYEQARLDMIKSIAEAKRQNAIDSAQNELDDINESKGYIKDLLDLTIEMIKKETEAKKDALKEQYDARKQSLKKQYDDEKDALNKRLQLLKEEAERRKKALKKESEERTYQQELAEKQKKVTDTQNKIIELQNDDSYTAMKKRKELEEQLAEYKKDLEDYQYDRSIKLQEEAIDEQLKIEEDKIKKQLEDLEDGYKEEEELEEKKYKNELKEYEDLLKNKRLLKEKANALIQSKDQQFYENLKAYALDYTDTTEAEFRNLWDSAYEGIEKYGQGCTNVLDIMEQMTERAIELQEELKRIQEETTYKDYIEDTASPNDDYKIGTIGGNSKKESNKKENTSNKNLPTEAQAKKDAQLQQQKYLHNQMLEAKKTGNTQLAGWVKSERGRWGLDKETGKVVGSVSSSSWEAYKKKYNIKTRHTGAETGFVLDDSLLKENEEFAKLMKGELVVNPKQMHDFMTQTLPEIANYSPSDSGQIIIDMHDFNVTKDNLSDFKKLMKEEVPKIIESRLYKKGIK